MTRQWLSGPMWDGARLTPKLFVATSTALLLLGLLFVAGSGAEPWSFVALATAVAYIALMRSAMSEEPASAWQSRTMRMMVGIIGLALLVLVVVLSVQGVPAAAIAVVLAATLLLMSLVCGASYLLHWILAGALPRRLGNELAVAAAHAKHGRFALAVEVADRYTQRRPESPWGWTVSAGALLSLGHLEAALADADRAIALGGTTLARITRGAALFGLGLYEEACPDLRAASQESRCGSWLAHSYVLIGVRSLDDAVRVLTDPVQSSPNLTLYTLLGEAYRLLGDQDKAAAAYGEVVRRARMEVRTGDTLWLAYCMAMTGSLDEARTLAVDVLTREDETSAFQVLALLATLREDRDQAYDALRRLLLAWPRGALGSLTDPLFTPLLDEKRFRELLAWSIGALRQTRERLRERFPHLFPQPSA